MKITTQLFNVTQGLFRFALEATRAEDAPNPSDFEEMDEEVIISHL